MSATRIGAVQINVTDLDAAILFYEKLGFSVNGRGGYPRVVSLRHAGDFFLLLFKVDISTNPAYHNGSQVVINLETKDLRATIALLKQRGVEMVHGEPQPFPNGYFAALRDPAGNILEYVEWRDYDKARRMILMD